MTSPQGFQLTFRKPREGWLTAAEIMKAFQWLNQFFIMSQLFVCQNLPFSHCHEKCSQTSMAPLILYEIALQFLCGTTWRVWAVNSCTTTHPGSVSLSAERKVRRLFGGKFRLLPPPIMSCIHKALFEYYSHHPTKLFNSCDSRWGSA